MSGDYAGFLKIGEYIKTETSEDTAARCRHDKSFVYEIAASLCLPLQYLSMPDVNAACDCVKDADWILFFLRLSKIFLVIFVSFFLFIYYAICYIYSILSLNIFIVFVP